MALKSIFTESVSDTDLDLAGKSFCAHNNYSAMPRVHFSATVVNNLTIIKSPAVSVTFCCVIFNEIESKAH